MKPKHASPMGPPRTVAMSLLGRRAIAIVSLLVTMALGAAAPAPTQDPQPKPARYRSSPSAKPPSARPIPERLEQYRRNAAGRSVVDFAQQFVYAEANKALPPPAAGQLRVVFLGDSITDFWNLPAFFGDRPYVNRGISGQVTPQLLIRFHADVVALKPAAVVILAGVNDASGVVQNQTDQQIETNYEALADLAAAHGIKPIFAKILPINRFDPARDAIAEDRDPAPLERLNAWLERFCQARGYGLIDYGPVLAGPDGQLRTDFSDDGVHPNDKGYAAMAPVAQAAIDKALAR